MLPLGRQGKKLVARDDTGRIRAHAVVQNPNDTRPQTWRRALSRLTNDGMDMLECLYSLMHGNAYTPKVYDQHGKLDPNRTCDPIIPTAEVRRAAAKDLHEMLRGKAVAETEVIASEHEAAKLKQLDSMSDAQLQAYIDGEYKLVESGESLPTEGALENGADVRRDSSDH